MDPIDRFGKPILQRTHAAAYAMRQHWVLDCRQIRSQAHCHLHTTHSRPAAGRAAANGGPLHEPGHHRLPPFTPTHTHHSNLITSKHNCSQLGVPLPTEGHCMSQGTVRHSKTGKVSLSRESGNVTWSRAGLAQFLIDQVRAVWRVCFGVQAGERSHLHSHAHTTEHHTHTRTSKTRTHAGAPAVP